MKVNIHTVERGKPDLESDRKNIDWADSSDRKWLQNHLHWAMNNDRLVTLTPLPATAN